MDLNYVEFVMIVLLSCTTNWNLLGREEAQIFAFRLMGSKIEVDIEVEVEVEEVVCVHGIPNCNISNL